MTSGNVSDEPIAHEDEDALRAARGHRRPRARPRPPDPHAHGRLGAARRPALSPAAAAPLARVRARLAAAAGQRPAAARVRGGAQEHVLRRQGRAGVGRPPHRRPQVLRGAAGLRGGDRALRAPVRGRARGRRPRRASRLPLDPVRARPRGRRDRRGPAPPRPPRGVPGRARRAPAARPERSTTARATAATAASGAGRSSSATCATSSAPRTCGRSASRAATPRSASRGGWRSRGCSRPAGTVRCRARTPIRSPSSFAPASRRRGRRAWGGCSTRSRRCAGCATR